MNPSTQLSVFTRYNFDNPTPPTTIDYEENLAFVKINETVIDNLPKTWEFACEIIKYSKWLDKLIEIGYTLGELRDLIIANPKWVYLSRYPELLKDREVVRAIIDNQDSKFKYAVAYHQDKEIINIILSHSQSRTKVLKYAKITDKEMIRRAVSGNIKNLRYTDLLQDVDFVISCMNKHWSIEDGFIHLDNKKFVLAAMNLDCTIELSRTRIKKICADLCEDDLELLYLIVKNSPFAAKHTHLTSNHAVLAKCIHINGAVLRYFRGYHTDKEMVSLAVKTCPSVMKRFKKVDLEMVITAIDTHLNCACALQFAKRFKRDKEVVLRAIAVDTHAFAHAGAYKNDVELFLSVVILDYTCAMYGKHLLQNPKVLKRALTLSPEIITLNLDISAEMLAYGLECFEPAKHDTNGMIPYHLCLKMTPEMFILAGKKGIKVVEHTSEFLSDRNAVIRFMQESGVYVMNKKYITDEEVILHALKAGMDPKYLSLETRSRLKIALYIAGMYHIGARVSAVCNVHFHF